VSNLWIALLLLGVGVWLAHDGLAPRPYTPQAHGPRVFVDRVRDWLAQADLPGVTIWHLAVLCGASCVTGGIAGYVIFGVPVSTVSRVRLRRTSTRIRMR
jgi:hypothetical protein